MPEPSIPPPPPSSRSSLIPAPPPQPKLRQAVLGQLGGLVEHLGQLGMLTRATVGSMFKRPFETTATVYQIESLGVRSMGIVLVTSIFIGMVMTIQFAYGLRRFGGVEYIPRVIILSFLRELGPTLTAVIVGGRIGSGMAAEVGAMNVTEQVDAIRALGGEPAKKLVLPRVAAAVIVMPLLSIFADAVGTIGAIIVCAFEFDITPQLFMRSALEVVRMGDLWTGIAKTPFFGFIIAIVGCHFGLQTTGGTEGVGRSTTRSVVVISISILIADYFLTRLMWSIFPQV